MSSHAVPLVVAAVWAAAVALAGSAGGAPRDGGRAPASPTFNRDIAPIVFERCAPCHRPGEAAPFSLLSYTDVRRRARQIAEVTARRYMPPWLPEPGYGRFAGDRRLTDREVALIREWVRGGGVEGDPADLPPPPRWVDGWQLGEPDLVLEMPEPYTLAAESSDVFRNFVIPIPVPAVRYVRGLEFRPGNPRVVHHAIMKIDRERTLRSLEGRDTEPGFGGMIVAEGESPDGHFLGWSPGKVPSMAPDGLAWRLNPGSDLILQLHLQPTGKPERIRSSIGLYFTDRPPARTPFGLQLGSYVIDIPPGEREYVVEDSYVLPVDVELHALYPHAHYLGKEVQAFALLPDGTKDWLIWIRRWDFDWQDEYRYVEPLALPRGATLVVRFTYDNSAENPRNPHQPPRRVTYGGQSTDEMGNLWLQVVPRHAGDLAVLNTDVERKATERSVAGYEQMLREAPGHAGLRRALGAAYLRLGRVPEAVQQLGESLRIEPGDPFAHYNLGHAFAAAGRLPEAARHFERAAEIRPDYAEAHNNLGVLLQALGRPEDATARYRRALEIDPDYAEAHNNLGVMLQAQGRLEDAIGHFRQAVALRPEYTLARENLASALDAQRKR